MLAVIIGLAGALVYGSADFIGGLASKRLSAVRVTALGGFSGLVLLTTLLLFFGGTWSVTAVVLGAITGLTGSLAIMLLYGCLAIGPMSILSPLTAVISATVPVLVGVLRGDRLSALGALAIGIAFVAVVLVGFVPEKGALRPSLVSLAMAVAAGMLIGVFLILIDLTPHDSGLVPLVMNRAVNCVVLFGAIGIGYLVARRRRAKRRRIATVSGSLMPSGRGVSAAEIPVGLFSGPLSFSAGWRPGLILGLVGGVLDASANALVLFGLRLGELTIQSVLTALYPAGTILLAAIILKERIAPIQLLGLVLAIVAAVMLAATGTHPG